MKKVLAVLKSPRRLLAYYGLQMAYKLRLNHIPILPTVVDIEPNNWCNFRCDHCQVTHWDKQKAQLDVRDFSYITDQFPNLLKVKVQGMGEPFLNKSTIGILEYLDNKGIVTNTISNGSVLTDALTTRLSQLKLTSIGFSLDGGTQATFEGIRIRGNFEKVTDNIKSLLVKAPKLDTAFWVVVSQDNYTECEEIVNLAKCLGVSKVVFQTFITDWGKDSMKEKIHKKTVNESAYNRYISKATELGAKKGIHVEHYLGNKFTAKQPCQWPWSSMMIDASGNVIPCCVLADSDTINFGNIFEQKIEKIWNSEEYKDFRKAHSDGDIPEPCRACYSKACLNDE